jgi:hypothetical protein
LEHSRGNITARKKELRRRAVEDLRMGWTDEWVKEGKQSRIYCRTRWKEWKEDRMVVKDIHLDGRVSGRRRAG